VTDPLQQPLRSAIPKNAREPNTLKHFHVAHRYGIWINVAQTILLKSTAHATLTMRPSSTLLVSSLLTAHTLAFAIPNPFAKRAAFPEGYEYSNEDSTQGSGSSSTQTYNNGQWNPSTTAQYETSGEASSTQSVVNGIYPTSETLVITSAPQPADTATATANWETIVTWPAGCESWANPCPSGAHISGGGVADESGYTNGFTSYLTETNSEGVITGMPAVATNPAGVSDTDSSTLQTAAQSSNVSPTGSSSTTTNQSSASKTSSSASSSFQTGAAVPNKATFGGAALLGAAGVVVALL